ncbi:hypothetical protein I3F58_00025 [Streptomyces sp. MUM 203J]|uniref:DUF5959 family protein n=1 Tax=Streptomyces sp. MUM 203J TaxID=2791990 RepID=UPI001F04671F|nr:DUF5959 family protein [Streptomyces sp. MUM 203J]MCH0537971.1 hypothetical protein [Streptomyces sp. MUM 203J]
MAKQDTITLISFNDHIQSLEVHLSLEASYAMQSERYHSAEIELKSDFVSGRVSLQISLRDLDDWERCLTSLNADEGIEWPAGGRSAWLAVTPDDPVEVTVHDSPSTQISVRIPIDVDDDWLDDSRRRLAFARNAIARE